MRTYTKRCISLLLAIVMLTSLLSMPAEAIEYWRTGAARIDPSMLEDENSYELELYPVHNEYELQTVPGIYGEPQSVSAPVGTTVYFYVAAYGTGTISYQWQYQVPGSATWANVTAAAGKTALYSLTVQARHDQYKYRCRVTNSSGTAVSKTAVLSVVEVPKITAEPTDVSATIGKPATFSVTASGNGTLTYQWQYSTDGGENWINVTTNGKARTYTISSVAARHLSYLYRCEVSLSGGGSVTSDSARLVSVPVITISPASKTASVGETVTFTSSVTGGVAPYTYRWQYRTSSSGSWTNISTNGTGANYTLTAAARHNGYQYRCTVTDKNGNSATSGVSTLYVDDLKVTIFPATATVTIGKTATFTSSVTGGTAPYSYRWQYRTSASGTWTNISSNGTGASYSVTVALRHNGYQYRCTVTDKNGNSATSGVSTLYADDFRVTVSPASKTVYVGETATFTTSVTGGTAPYSYRWQYRTSASGTWTNVSTNGTGASYSVTAARRHDGYQYRCTVTDKNGNTATSVTTTLNVQEKPNPLSAAITPSSDQYVTEGDTVTLKATASGGAGGYTYKWFRANSSSVTGTQVSTSQTYKFTAETAYNGYYYYCEVTDSAGTTVETSRIRVYVDPIPDPLTVTITPSSDQYVDDGDSVTLKATASGGSGGYTYKWYRASSSTITGTQVGTSQTYTVTPNATYDGYYYYCKVKDSAGNTAITSRIRVYWVPDELTATITPSTDQYVDDGDSVTLKATASGGTGGYTYKWYRASSSSVTGTQVGTSQTYTVTPSTTYNGYYYYCQVTDSAGNTAITSRIRVYMGLSVSITPSSDQYVGVGDLVTLKATASGGSGGYTYKWYRASSENVTGTQVSTNQSYQFTASASYNGYYYYCQVTDSSGNTATTSRILVVVYTEDLFVTISPSSDQYVDVGDSVTLKATASGGSGGYTYKWYRASTENVTGSQVSTNQSYTFTASSTYSGYYYYCQVTDSSGNWVNTSRIRVYVELSASITPSSNQYVDEGDSVTLKATASGGSGGYTYKWYRAASSNVTGTQVSTSQTYEFTAETAYNSYYYYCKVTDSAGDWVNTSRIQVFVDALITRLPKPTGVAIDAVTNNAVSVRFNAVSGASGYYMYYSTSNSFSTSLSRVEADKSTLVGYVDGLSSGKTYYFWIVAYDASGTLGYESASASTITASVSTPVLTEKNTGTRFYDGQIYDWNMSSAMLLQFSATNGNGDFEVRAFGMSKAPSFDSTDVNYSTEFYYPGSGEGNEVWNESSLSGFGGALPFGAPAKSETKYIKIWIRARDKNYSVNNASSAGVQFGIKIVSETTVMLMMPVVIQDSWVQNTFGVYRNTSKLHFGNDLAATANTTIKSARGGTVTAVGSDSSRGNYVIVKDEKYDLYYHYMHMISTAVVSTGQKVSMGTVLGYVGSTGNSTGNHLHFDVTYQTSSLTAGTRELNTNHRTRGDQTNWQYFPSSAYIRTSVREYSSLAAAIAAFKSVDIGFRLDYID